MWQDLKDRKVLVFNQEVPLLFLLAVFIPILLIYPLRYVIHLGHWTTNTHEQYGYRFEYPASWILENHGEEGARFADYARTTIGNPNFFNSTSINVHEKKMDEEVTIFEVISWGDYNMHRLDDRAIEGPELTSIGLEGYQAYKVTYLSNDRRRRTEIYFLLLANEAFAIEISDLNKDYSENYDAYYRRILNSFEFFEVAEG